jgi:vanillate O-demethylase monooxygenase subunit
VPAPFHRQLGEFNGPVDRRFHYEFYVPGILLMLSHVKPSDTPDDDMRGALRMHSCQALTPETESSTHYFFMAAHDYKLDDESVTESIYRSVCEAFEEDKKIITAQQRLIERSNPAPLQPIPADGALGQFRFIVKQMADKEQRR